MSPSHFSSLPNDIVWQVLARVPKCKYPLLACVSKNFTYLVQSPEIHKIRSLLRKDSLYISFRNKKDLSQCENPRWYTLRRAENNPSENQFVSVGLALPNHYHRMPSIVAHGPEIFFICKPFFPTSSFWVFDSRSDKLRQGPSMAVYRTYKSVGVVGRKVYVVGGVRTNDNVAEAFDLNTQTWEPAPIPKEIRTWHASATVSLDRKVCALVRAYAICYDTRDGSCEDFALAKDKWWKTGVCGMENVLYVYYARFGLMWYDTKLRVWRVVNGLDHVKKVRSVGMAEYYGKVALLWKEHGGCGKEIWCRMIAMGKCEEGVKGTAESAQLLGSVPDGYRMDNCLSVSD